MSGFPTFHLSELFAISLYFIGLIAIAVFTYKKQTSDTDFIIGNRSMNFFLTAFAAHASDMSSWLFMGYPAVIYSLGLSQVWVGIGLLVFFLLNWQLIAPKVRAATEQYDSLTFSSFFECRLGDTTGLIRVFTALMLFIFYTIYISAALYGMGLVLNILFGIPYYWGVVMGILIVLPYVFIGGYLTLAQIDLFQGSFLLIVILFVPFYALSSVGGFSGIHAALQTKGLTSSLIPNWKVTTLLSTFFLATGWGLGYFGQPHIITKFMGIKNVTEIWKSKVVGMSWMTLALGAATLVGLVGVPFFTPTLKIDEEVFIKMVQQLFSPFLTALFLCAVFAASVNAMSSMVLVLSSSLTEDIYKRIFRTEASSKELLTVSRLSVIFVCIIAFFIAFKKIDTIYGLVQYAWSGLGASFGPLLLCCLHLRFVNRYGAWCGILAGGGIAAFWPLVAHKFPIKVPSLPPAFLISFILIWLISYLTRKRTILTEIS